MAAPAPPSQAECDKYDSNHIMGGAVAAGAGVLAGIGGIGASTDSDKTLRIGLGVGSLAMGGLAAAAAYFANQNAQRYTEKCTAPSARAKP